MTPEVVRTKLWREAADKHLYVILDGAQNQSLLDVIDAAEDLRYECLFTGKLEPDMAEVAPYLVELTEDSDFTQWVFEQGWAQNWGIFVVSPDELGEVWRHLRRHTRVRDANRRQLFFRYYDPRVLSAFLPTCDERQLREFFGLVDMFFAELEGGGGLSCFSLAEGKLVTQVTELVKKA